MALRNVEIIAILLKSPAPPEATRGKLNLRRDRKKAGELCGSRLPLGLRIESRIPFVELLSEFFI
jgi:hypothetical protein